MKRIITIVMIVISIFGMGGFLQNQSERKAKIDLNEIYKKNEEGNLVQGKEKINEMNNGTYPQVSLKGNNYNYWKWLYIDSTNDRGLDEEYFPSGYGENRGKVKNGTWQTRTYEVKRIKVNEYSNGWDDFWKYYSNIYIDFKYSYNLWNGWDDWSYEGGKNRGELKGEFWFNKNEVERGVEKNSGLLQDGNHSNNEIAKYNFWCEKNGNEIVVKAKLETWYNWAGGSAVNHACFIRIKNENVSLNSNFNYEKYFNVLSGKNNGDKSNALGEGKIDGKYQSYYKGNKIKVEANENPYWYESKNMSVVKIEVEKRILKAFDNNKNIFNYFKNTSNNGRSGLEITPLKTGGVPKVVTQISFYNWNVQKNQKWEFRTEIDFKLGSIFWNKNIKDRINFKAGKVVGENGIEVVDDVEEVLKGSSSNGYNDGVLKYHTSVLMSFYEMKESANQKDYDSIKVNDKPLNGYNGQYSMSLENLPKSFDSSEENDTNTYKIEIVHSVNPNIVGDVGGKFSITIIIENSNDKLNLNLMNWGEKNPDYEKLTSPTIKDAVTGKEVANPDYDSEISKETGTRKQIVWVKKKSIVPFGYDPVSNDNYLITSKKEEDYDIGFIAEASEVGGVGYENYWDNEVFSEVNRFMTNEQLETDVNNKFEVKKGDKTIQTTEGIYHFTIKSKTQSPMQGTSKKIPPFYMNKYIMIKNNYGSFIDDINSANPSNIVSSFWKTDHGSHLRNYMVKYKGWDKADTKDFINLEYEGVMAYWRNYISDIRNNYANSDPNADNRVDLSLNDAGEDGKLAGFGMYLQTIKTGRTYNTSELIKTRLYKQVKEKIINRYETYDIEDPKRDEKGNIIKSYPLKNSVLGEDYDIYYEKNNFENGNISTTWEIISAKTDLSWFITNENDKFKEMNIKIVASNISSLMKNQSMAFKYINNYDILDPDKLIDLGELPIKDQIGNFGNLNKEKIYNNYIVDYIEKAVKALEEERNQVINRDDFTISTKGYNGEKISPSDERLAKFFENVFGENSKTGVLTNTIYAGDRSITLEGSKLYQIVHNPNLPNVPENPKNPNFGGDEDNGNNNGGLSSTFWGKFVIGALVVVFGISGAVLFMFYKWRWTRQKETYNTEAQRRKGRRYSSFNKRKNKDD